MRKSGIRSINVETSDSGVVESVKIVFGPHFFLDLKVTEEGKTQLVLGATHHGFLADASEVGGQLESLIEEIRRNHPDITVD